MLSPSIFEKLFNSSKPQKQTCNVIKPLKKGELLMACYTINTATVTLTRYTYQARCNRVIVSLTKLGISPERQSLSEATAQLWHQVEAEIISLLKHSNNRSYYLDTTGLVELTDFKSFSLSAHVADA